MLDNYPKLEDPKWWAGLADGDVAAAARSAPAHALRYGPQRLFGEVLDFCVRWEPVAAAQFALPYLADHHVAQIVQTVPLAGEQWCASRLSAEALRWCQAKVGGEPVGEFPDVSQVGAFPETAPASAPRKVSLSAGRPPRLVRGRGGVAGR